MTRIKKCIPLFLAVFIWISGQSVFAGSGTTGKISGKIIDAANKQAMIGVNVFLQDTQLGAATDIDGNFIILMIPPGKYTLEARYLGYKPVLVRDVRVSIDKTTKIDITMEEMIAEGEAIIFTAVKPIVKMDLTSTESVVGSEKIEQLPVERFEDIVNLQAGVTQGHFRGGRMGEVSYMIDGIPVNDVYSGSYAVEVDNSTIREIEVISGTFNAEYGQAMSGVVNIVTKDGGEKYEGQIETYFGNQFGSNDHIFKNVSSFNPVKNFQGSISGPVPGTKNKLTFFLSGRYYDSDGHIYGKHVFDPTDHSDFTSGEMENWIIESRGKQYNFTEETAAQLIRDAEYVSMNPSERFNTELKLTYRINSSFKISYNGLFQNSEWKDYDHQFYLNPYGTYKRKQTGNNNSIIWTHVLNDRNFYTLKFASFKNEYKQYVYEDVYDENYVSVSRLQDTGANAFLSGGQNMWHFYRSTNTRILKFDFTSQFTNTHQIKFGFDGKFHTLKLHEFEVLPEEDNRIPPLSSYNNNEYTKKPLEGSLYIQDKMEFQEVIVNAGIRFDYFNPKSQIPSDFSQPGSSELFDAESSTQLSPRFGIAYPISDKGVIHVSYGHFFQIPNYQFLYINPEFDILPLQSVPSSPPASLLNTIGNAGLKPQKTVIYELGLQQGLTEELALTLTAYYKDIRNLLGTEVHYTLQGIRYGRYINRDYGNVKGITVALEKRHSNNVSATLDYTFQIAQGNASDPNTAFLDQQTDPPKQTVKQLVPLNWDRRHSINLTVTYGDIGNYAVSLIGRLGTGMPYTPSYQNIQTAVENSARRPTQYSLDFYAYKDFNIGRFKYEIYIRGYNLLDRLNEVNVFSDTGRAGYSLAPLYVGGLRPRGINTLDDYYIRPDFYSSPRSLQAGVKFFF